MKKLDVTFCLVCLVLFAVLVLGGMAQVKEGATKTQVVILK